jgi:protein-L-isoaspartate O-methyltransferase
MFFCLFDSGEYRKDELLEAARSGNEEKLLSLLTSANVNCHASDGRKVCKSSSPFSIVFVSLSSQLLYI